jgi:4-amino-4-deoxy-L-arabinose transferase-like glycosyltransferase
VRPFAPESVQPVRSRPHLLWLIGGGTFIHFLSTGAVYVAGRYGILPNLIWPNGVLRGDSTRYFERSIALGQNLSALASGSEEVHVRLYAISTAVLAPLVGNNIFSVELGSLFLFLLTLFLIYQIGTICFERRTGFAAVVLVGLLPSFLLHQTQPLRDPLFVVLMLALLCIVLRLITKPLTAMPVLAYATSGILTLSLVWLVRDNFWLVYVGIVTLGLLAWIAGAIKDKRVSLPNLACLLFLLMALIFLPKLLSNWLPPKHKMNTAQHRALAEFTTQQAQRGLSGVFLKISATRQKFVIQYDGAGSNIDVGRTFPSSSAFIAYLPRAIVIGLFAPFPASWFKQGRTLGITGSVLASFETCFIYLLTPFALAGLWRGRRSVHVWFLLAVILLGAAALGLVVANVGALYRMRYVFWIVYILLAASYLQRCLNLQRLIRFNRLSIQQSA